MRFRKARFMLSMVLESARWSVAGVLLCAAAPLAGSESIAVPREVHVAATGSDTHPGTAERPVATLEKARDLLRSRVADEQKNGGSVVHVHAGTYLRTAPFELGKEDSGAEGKPVVYRAAGTVCLVGGRVVPGDAFRPVADPAVKARLPEAVSDQVLELDLKSLGIRQAGPFPDFFRGGGGIIELFIDGERMPLARWPDEGYTTIQRVLDSGHWQGGNRRGGTFVYRGDRPAEWQGAVADGLWLKGFWRVPWQPDTVRVAAIDPNAGTITHAREVGGGIGSKYSKEVGGTRVGDGNEKWYALNLLEELDRPGEWCLRFPTKMLYFLPPRELKDAHILISDMKEALVRMDHAEHVTFRGFALEGGLGNGVDVNGGSDILIAGCEIRNLGGAGVLIDGGHGHRVVSCDLHHLGQGGVYVGGGDRLSLAPAGHEVLNNHIHRVGQLETTYAPAIKLGAFGFSAVGCRVAHNLIHDLPHAAVLYGGNNHVIECNEVWRVALDSGDVGAFYTTHDWTSRGNLLRHNLVADSPRANAFYMDDGDSGDTIAHNVVWKTSSGSLIGGGHDNLVTGNLIIDCPRGIHLDDRGVYRGYNPQHQHLAGLLKKVRPTSPPWSERYPEMKNLLEFHPDWPTGNRITGNVLIGCATPIQLKAKEEHLKYSTIENNPVLSRVDAGLPEQENPIPALRSREIAFPDVPGFEPIPMAKIGLYRDEFRQALPQAGKGPRSADDEVFDSNTDIERSNRK